MAYRHDLVHGYQPLWIQGANVGEGRRSCEDRYRMISDALKGKKIKKILDVGAHSGYFAVRLAEEMGAEATAVDGNPDLKDALEAQASARVTGVHEYADAELLKSLGRFDVGLCLSVLHHVDWWPEMLEILSAQCRLLFVECAVPAESPGGHAGRLASTVAEVEKKGGVKIGESASFDGTAMRPMYLIGSRKRK